MRCQRLTLAPLFALLLCATSLRAQQTDSGPRHLRVIWTTEPQTRAVVSWSTRGEHDQNRVLLALDERSLQSEKPDDADVREIVAQRSGQFTRREDSKVEGWHYHHAEVTGLEPSTRYWLRVVSGDESSQPHHFTTAPADDRPFQLLSGGDSRSNPATRREMNVRMGKIAAESPQVLALAHGGDYVANGRSLSQWLTWLDNHDAIAETTEGQLVPVIPARGNHEGRGELYDEVWSWPGGEDAVNWFATELSPAVLLVTLNSETAAGGDQREFLESTLREHRGMRWQLAQYHRPLFPAVKTPGRAKGHWQPLFDQYRLDVVLESDGHVLKRTVPLFGDEPADDGIVYIGEGGLGVGQRTPRGERWYLEPPGMAMSAHHVWVLTFGERSGAAYLELEAIGKDGKVLDRTKRPARAR